MGHAKSEDDGQDKKEKNKKKDKESKRKPKVEEAPPVVANGTNGAVPHSGDQDLDFWLSGEAPAAPAAPPEPPKKAKKEKKEKEKEKKKRLKSSSSAGKEAAAVAAGLVVLDDGDGGKVRRDRSDYEVASGLCTPSKQPSNAPTPSPLPSLPVRSHLLYPWVFFMWKAFADPGPELCPRGERAHSNGSDF